MQQGGGIFVAMTSRAKLLAKILSGTSNQNIVFDEVLALLQHLGFSMRVNAVILLSGGLDSATVLAIARREGRACHALSFVYGQRHEVELAAARRVVGAVEVVEHIVFPIDLRLFGGSALTGDIDVPKD